MKRQTQGHRRVTKAGMVKPPRIFHEKTPTTLFNSSRRDTADAAPLATYTPYRGRRPPPPSICVGSPLFGGRGLCLDFLLQRPVRSAEHAHARRLVSRNFQLFGVLEEDACVRELRGHVDWRAACASGGCEACELCGVYSSSRAAGWLRRARAHRGLRTPPSFSARRSRSDGTAVPRTRPRGCLRCRR